MGEPGGSPQMTAAQQWTCTIESVPKRVTGVVWGQICAFLKDFEEKDIGVGHKFTGVSGDWTVASVAPPSFACSLCNAVGTSADISKPSKAHCDECELLYPGEGNTRRRITTMGMSPHTDNRKGDPDERRRANNQQWVWGHRIWLSRDARLKLKAIVDDVFLGASTSLSGLWNGVRARIEETLEVGVPAPDWEQCRLFYDALATDEGWLKVQVLEGVGSRSSGPCEKGHMRNDKSVYIANA